MIVASVWSLGFYFEMHMSIYIVRGLVYIPLLGFRRPPHFENG